MARRHRRAAHKAAAGRGSAETMPCRLPAIGANRLNRASPSETLAMG